MSILTKSLFYLFAICYLLFANSLPAHAASEFSTTFTSNYTVTTDNLVSVTHEITLTNQLSHIYPTEYTVLIGSNNITNITTTQDGTTTNHLITKSANTTTITLNQLSPVVGQDQSTILVLAYQTPDLIETLGRTRSINIPRIAKANEATALTRNITIPKEFGQPSIQYPPATRTSSDHNGDTVLSYHGHPLSSLTLLFGDSEYYQLDLLYQIYNPTLATADTEIALPPDTAYQHAILDQISPTPQNVYLDQDGNWLASYSLKSKEVLDIHLTMYLEVFATAQTKASLVDPKSYLIAQPYWELDNQSLKALATKLTTAENIYEYTRTNLTYDYSSLDTPSKRLGAAKSLELSSGICTEFTDVFVALARSAKIPARALIGFAYTDNTTLRPLGSNLDTLHSWPEYYREPDSTWIQLDPTWASTSGGIDYFHKLDFNHLTFVINGQESDYPLPVGAYKQDPDLKAINVTLTSKLPSIDESLEYLVQDDNQVVYNRGNIAVKTESGELVPPGGHLSISKNNLTLNTFSLHPSQYQDLLLGIIIIIVFLVLRRFKV